MSPAETSIPTYRSTNGTLHVAESDADTNNKVKNKTEKLNTGNILTANRELCLLTFVVSGWYLLFYYRISDK